MNYIKQLKSENRQLKEQISSALHELDAFNIFLHGPKFTGTENGERKDWISTSDVILTLNEIKRHLPSEKELEIKN